MTPKEVIAKALCKAFGEPWGEIESIDRSFREDADAVLSALSDAGMRICRWERTLEQEVARAQGYTAHPAGVWVPVEAE